MNHNEDVAFNTLKLASKEESYSMNSGSLIVNGGLACKKSIICKNIINDCLLNKKSAIFENDVIISKNLKVNVIVPKDEEGTKSIGSSDNRFNDIYTNNVDSNNIYINNLTFSNTIKSNYLIVNNSAEIGKNDKNNTMIYVDDQNNTITTNSDIFKVRNNNELSFEVDYNQFFINTLIKYKYSKIDLIERTYNLYPESSIIILNGCVQNPQVSLMINKNILSSNLFENGTFIKIFNKSVKTCIIIEKHILPINSFIEFIMIDSEWIILRNDSSENESFRAYRSAYFNGDIECSDDSHDDCDSSSNFEKEKEKEVEYIPNTNNHRVIRRLKNTSCATKIGKDSTCKTEPKEIKEKVITESEIENSTSFDIFN